MSFEPEKFFIGVIDFFSILMPGALLAYLGKDCVACYVLHQKSLPLRDPERWIIFLFMAYLLGHMTFLVGSLLDRPYDWLRACTDLGQIRRLAKGKNLASRSMRTIAGWLFGRDADAAIVQAIRIKSRALLAFSPVDAINAYQWCKARLSKDHPAGLLAVQRFEADSKFFRSFAIVLVVLEIVNLLQNPHSHKLVLSATCLCLLLPALWRYIDQRFKATQQAYWFLIALESMKDHSILDTTPKPKADGLTHAGGVVFRKRNDAIEYLLVQASTNRSEWVLPKGHIELGESARETAAREVQEETGCWAQVIHWIDDCRLGDGSEAPMVRFLLMELVMEKESEWPTENRQHRWLSLDAAKQTASHKETVLLLVKAAGSNFGPMKTK